MSRQHKAFTLVELLVVMGIIAILIGVLLPTLASARKSANLLKCQATMRELGLAMQMYGNVHKGYVPATRVGFESFHTGSVQLANCYVFWWMRLQQHKFLPGIDDPTRSVAICPSDDTPYWPFHEYPTHKNLQSSYGMNPLMSTANDENPYAGGMPARAPIGVCDWYGHQQPKVNRAKNASEKILIAEVRQGWFVSWFAPNTFEGPQPGSDWFDFDWYRHARSPSRRTGGRMNILWLDGHVTTVNQGTDKNGNFNNEIFSGADWVVGSEVAKRGERQWYPNK